jgi:lambda repressor-like predicted transcriptional regulator
MHQRPRRCNSNFPVKVRAALMLRGMTIASWARLAGYGSATQVSLAIHGHRRHPKARRIVAQLKALVKGLGR